MRSFPDPMQRLYTDTIAEDLPMKQATLLDGRVETELFMWHHPARVTPGICAMAWPLMP
jgi:hypothetical protein